jgi:hypothetical protein
MMLTLSAGLAGCAQSPGDYRIVTTPGPRGTMRAVRINTIPETAAPLCQSPAERAGPRGYRFVTTPGPRGTTRLVRTSESQGRSRREADSSCK